MATINTDPSLIWVDYDPTALKIPQDIFYQSTTADTSNSSGFSFYVITPASNALLDNEAYIEYTLVITDTTAGTFAGQFEGAANGTNDNEFANNALHVALRQCWPMIRAMQNLSLNINGTVISCQPYIWVDAMNRLYISEEEAGNICTLSGGEFDTGYRIPWGDDMNFNSSRAAGNPLNSMNWIQTHGYFPRSASVVLGCNGNPPYDAGTQANVNLFPFMPRHEFFENHGFSKRFYRLARTVREEAAAVGSANTASSANRYADSVTLTIFERVPIAPFLLYDSRDYHMSIPHVRTMTLACQYSSNAQKLIAQQPTYYDIGGNTDYDFFSGTRSNLSINYYDNKPILHLKWIMSKDIIPPNITIPAYIVREYGLGFDHEAIAATQLYGPTRTINYSNINLEGIPDLLLVFLRKNPANAQFRDPSEHFLSIESLQLTVAGTTGKMNNISSGELYALWLKNVVHRGINKQSYRDWYRHGSVAALRPKDYGCLFGPGMDYPVQISLSVSYTNNNVVPVVLNNATGGGNKVVTPYYLDNIGAAISYTFYVVCVYQRYSLSLNSGGGSRLSLLKVPLVNDAVVSQAPMQVNP